MSSSHTTPRAAPPSSQLAAGPCLAKANLVGHGLQALHQGWQVPFCLARESDCSVANLRQERAGLFGECAQVHGPCRNKRHAPVERKQGSFQERPMSIQGPTTGAGRGVELSSFKV